MLRLLSTEAQGRKDFKKSSKPCHVGIHWIALTEYSQLSTHMTGFSHFYLFPHFVLAKLVITSIRVRIGWWGHSRTTFCHDLNLLWPTQFISRDIQFDIKDMKNTNELNMRYEMGDNKNLLNIWSQWCLTPTSKITIIKSLLLLKITHCLLSIPSTQKPLKDALVEYNVYLLWVKQSLIISRGAMATIGRQINVLRP